MEELDDILHGDGEAAAVVETEAEVTTEAPETAEDEQPKGPVRDEKGRFAPKGETNEGASPAPQEAPLDHAALIGERRRRQEAEDRARQLEEYVRQQMQTAPQQQTPQVAPEVWDDGFGEWLVEKAAERAAQTAQQTAAHVYQNQRIHAAAMEAQQRIPDYHEKIAVFEQMAYANPRLFQELVQSPNPAEYAYNIAKTQIEISQFGGIDGLVQARVQEALQARQSPGSTIPTSLAGEQSSRAAGGAAGQTLSLDDILKR